MVWRPAMNLAYDIVVTYVQKTIFCVLFFSSWLLLSVIIVTHLLPKDVAPPLSMEDTHNLGLDGLALPGSF